MAKNVGKMGIEITLAWQSAREEANIVLDEVEDEAVDKEEEIETLKTAKVINC